MEEWRTIPGYPDRFEVSNLGRVRVRDYEYTQSLRGGGVATRRRSARVLTQCVNHQRGGYAQVTLTFTEAGTRRVRSGKVHRMVALAFVPNPHGAPEVNHKDSSKLNNFWGNLEWVTKSENARHNYASGTRKPHRKKRPIVGVRGEEVVEFDSLLSAQKSGLFCMGAIQRCIVGKARHHKGFVWSYKGELNVS